MKDTNDDERLPLSEGSQETQTWTTTLPATKPDTSTQGDPVATFGQPSVGAPEIEGASGAQVGPNGAPEEAPETGSEACDIGACQPFDGTEPSRSADDRPMARGCIVLDCVALRRLRNARLMTQQDLADHCWRRNIRISIATIKRAELGFQVRYRIARELARCFDVPLISIIEKSQNRGGRDGCDPESIH